MKIGISSSGQSNTSLLDPRFGRCSFFAVYDTDDNSYRFIENKAQNAGGGAGIAAAQQMVDEDAEIIITGNMGPNAYNVIAGAGIKIYRAGNVSLEKAVQLYKEAKLEAIAEAGAAHFGMGQGPRGGL
jgi:predicted Fe-Mo cluster-binding NifX family protein